MAEPLPNLPRETQQQRWVKYGANVALAIVVAIALTVLLTYLAQSRDYRVDTTAGAVYSLKPQTLGIIQNVKTPIKIISLYSEEVAAGRRDAYDRDIEELRKDAKQRAAVVLDLLNEYRKSGKKIEVEWIDFAKYPSKVDALVNEVAEKYGGEVKSYKDFFTDFAQQYDNLKKLTSDEAKIVDAIPNDEIASPELQQALVPVLNELHGYPEYLAETKQAVDKVLKQKPPDYKGAADVVRATFETLSERLATIQSISAKEKDDKSVPVTLRGYLASDDGRLAVIKSKVDGVLEKVKKLGDLKLDTLRTSLRQRDAILVMGDNDLRVLPYDQIWRSEATLRQFAKDGKVKPTFAGEQLITTAIYGLTQTKKTKIAFVRPGGGPLTNEGIPGFQQGGPLSQIASRLREYNFDVVEKDLSGQYAMQAEQQGMPVPPDPSDAELQDAIWVVIAAPMNNAGPMGPMPSPIGPKLVEHLGAGGSALVLPFPQEDSVTAPLKSWGIDLRTDAVAVHETPPPQANSSTNDPAQDLQRYSYVFNIRDYGDALLTKPLRSLDSLLVPLLPMKTHSEKGVTVTPILAIPDAPKAPRSWGETDLSSLERNEPPTFDPKQDVPGPLWAGAVAEKQGAGRVVVLGAPYFVFNRTLDEVDPELARRGMFVPAFPGNTELFTSSIFWLSHQEAMIAISPAALQVPRIADMSDATLNAWRVGLLLVGLPGAVIVAGFMMYLARRD